VNPWLVFACVEVDSQTASSTELAIAGLASQSQTGSYVSVNILNYTTLLYLFHWLIH